MRVLEKEGNQYNFFMQSCTDCNDVIICDFAYFAKHSEELSAFTMLKVKPLLQGYKWIILEGEHEGANIVYTSKVHLGNTPVIKQLTNRNSDFNYYII
jgi:hypothetical protein